MLALANASRTTTVAPTELTGLRVFADAAVRTRLLACADGRRLVAVWSDRVAGSAILALPPTLLGPRSWRVRCHQPVSGAVRDLDQANFIILPDPMDPLIIEFIPLP